jgi:AbrB family looped-hinge helix DNA binding protein
MPRTRLSSKGQLIIPKEVRDRHGWRPGTELEVVDKGHVVELRPAKPFPPTRFEDVRGMLKYKGPPVSIEDMDRAVDEAAREMWEEFERQSRE